MKTRNRIRNTNTTHRPRGQASGPSAKIRSITERVRIDRSTLICLDAVARATGKTRNEAVDFLIKAYLLETEPSARSKARARRTSMDVWLDQSTLHRVQYVLRALGWSLQFFLGQALENAGPELMADHPELVKAWEAA